MQSVRNLRLFAVSLAGMLAVSACGGDSGPAGSSTISQLQANVVGAEATSQVGDIAAGVAGFGFTGDSLGGGFFSRAALRGRMTTLERVVPSRYRSQLAQLRGGDPNCVPTATGDTTDSDGDGIENNATYTFTAANCFYQDTLGNGFAVTGSVSIQDTDGGATLFGFAIDFNRRKVLFYSDSASAGFDWDGTHTATVTSATATTNQAFTARWRVNDLPVYSARYSWGLVYTPDTGTIDPSTQQTLPDGTFDLTGAYAWSGQFGTADGDWTFNISTPTPLHWSSSCEGLDPPFDGGQVRASINGRSNIGFTADFTACGTPPVITTFDNTNAS
jgi:hypothetical protein